MEEPLACVYFFPDDVADAGSPHVVAHGALDAAGLVENKVLQVVVDAYAYAIDAHHGLVGVNAHALFGDDLAVNFYAAGIDEFF